MKQKHFAQSYPPIPLHPSHVAPQDGTTLLVQGGVDVTISQIVHLW